MEFDEILARVKELGNNLVELTGGEPLVQKESLPLMKQLCDLGYAVMLETGGSLPIQDIDPRVKIIMDLKCPSSRMMKKNLYSNLEHIKPTDEIKFVIGSDEDYEWCKEQIEKYDLQNKCILLFSTVFSQYDPKRLVALILKDKLNVRFQLQMHKFIWKPEERGV